jgi:hypothetical protein
MASFQAWLEVLSWIKALFEATTLGVDLQRAYQQHHEERATIDEAQRVSVAFSTFSEDEVEAILKRLKACRDRFITEGSGQARRQCLCSVFKDVIDGNGGTLPHIDDWENIFRQLSCSKGH